MNNHKLNILFVIKINKTRKNGEAPLNFRITYKGKRKEIATGQFIKPSHWMSTKQIAFPLEEHNYFNSQLSLISQKLNQAFLLLQFKEDDFNVDDIYNSFLGKKSTSEKTIKDAFEYHTNRMQKLVGIDVKQVSVQKYFQTLEHVKTYLKFKYNKSDYLLKDVKLTFLHDFEYYLKTENTVYKTLQRLKRVLRVSVGAEYLIKDPFVLHRANKPKVQVVFLTTEELQVLEQHQFTQLRLQQVKDWFIFSCYTGLAYAEIKNLKMKQIVKGFDGELWIEMVREKTQKNISVPLLPKAQQLIDKYADEDSEFVFKIYSNQSGYSGDTDPPFRSY
jgi:integrase